MERNWRDAKIPQWVKDSIEAEMKQASLTAALAWPTEANPAPMPFQWGEYDHEKGTPVAGTYWTPNGRRIEIRKKLPGEKTKGSSNWLSWVFRAEGSNDWTTTVVRGPLFATQHDARLYTLWVSCEECASRLMHLRQDMYA